MLISTTKMLRCTLSAVFPFIVSSLYATTWYVGPARTYTYCSQVAPLVQANDTVLIDAATYVNDPQVIWNKNNLYIAGNGGRPRLEAGSIIANDMVNGKGIFVISGSNVRVHNIEFANAVVQDHNGAGIRQEGANLWVSNCLFTQNEMGILCGNIPGCKTTIEYCAFFKCGSALNPGYQHNIYINHIDTLLFRFNYSHDAVAEGHELKSRASYNFILYNRIANEESVDSRTIDLPNGGTSVIVGNIIEQGTGSANSNILGYGLEGLTNPAPNALYCCNNTFINKKANGSFIQVANGTDTLFVKNNVFAGARTGGLIIGVPAVLDSSDNAVNADLSYFGFEDDIQYNYHLLANSPLIDRGVPVSQMVNGYALTPLSEYLDICLSSPRMVSNGSIDLGAFEYTFPLGTTAANSDIMRVFPNPASSEIQIELPDEILKNGNVYLMDMLGEMICSQPLHSGRNAMDISGLAGGIYFVCVMNDDNIFTRKLFKH